MERAGASRRLPAAILDGFVVLILMVAGVSIYASVAGSQLAIEAQRTLGVPVSWDWVTSDIAWQQYERRVDEVVSGIQRTVEEEFTPEQANRIHRIIGNTLETYFAPENLSVQFFLEMDQQRLDLLIDQGFDSVIASGGDMDPADVNKLRGEVKSAVREFGIGTILPRAITFVVWLIFVPVIIILVYGLGEGVFGRSLGKLALGIAVRRDDGERAYAGNYLLRYAIKNSPMLLMILALFTRSIWLAGMAGLAAVVVAVGTLVLLGPERRAIYDYISGTAVFRVVPGSDE